VGGPMRLAKNSPRRKVPAGTGDATRFKQLFASLRNSGLYHHNVYDHIGIAESSTRIFSQPPRIVLFVEVSGASDVCAKCVLWGHAMAEQIRHVMQDHRIDLATALGEEVPDLGVFSESFTLRYAIAVVSDCFVFIVKIVPEHIFWIL
jgi:hypothetical protein